MNENNREVILNHYKNPINKRENNDENYIDANANNASCVDNITVKVKLKDEIIEDITFDGEACAISISSTSIMIENLIGKTKEEAKIFILEFEKMINNEEYDKNILRSATVYCEMYKQNARKTCALLPYIAIKKVF